MPAAGEGEEDDFGDDSLLEADPTHVCNRQELLRQFFKVKPANAAQDGQRLLVGMIGYPNVGKSSTINALCQAKKVAVSSTPGKTKHFQTLLLGDDVCLCDCPGLVFPSFVSTKAEMIVNGLLPIDQMRDHLPPVTLVVFLFPLSFGFSPPFLVVHILLLTHL
jgi:large subunit GTPase 1